MHVKYYVKILRINFRTQIIIAHKFFQTAFTVHYLFLAFSCLLISFYSSFKPWLGYMKCKNICESVLQILCD